MATGARSGNNAREGTPEKLQSVAEERFLAGDFAGALRVAQDAKALCRMPVPSSLAHALAAYEVHAAASGSGSRNWYAVLGLACRGVTREDIKRRYRRLCLVLHPDKNRSAAADGAFKLLQDAWAALSARHPPAPPSADQKPSNHSRPPPAAAAPTEAEKRRASPPAASDTSCSRKPRREAPPPRTFRSAYCARCYHEFRAPGDEDDEVEYCGRCQEWLRNPRRRAPADADVETPRQGGSRSFLCPGACTVPGCRGQYVPCMLAVGMWKLRCRVCGHQPGGPPMGRDDLFDMCIQRAAQIILQEGLAHFDERCFIN
ncbi:uncharacterized protein [Lolium perenne]|uniref:uncharacterized protein n=1 Tax=Lolium perenne TaxID=4522 RepID=UPI0021F63240|nr:uncharacterized protein LOC127346610 [Lolium perenne]